MEWKMGLNSDNDDDGRRLILISITIFLYPRLQQIYSWLKTVPQVFKVICLSVPPEDVFAK
jgi:hypothetical protein